MPAMATTPRERRKDSSVSVDRQLLTSGGTSPGWQNRLQLTLKNDGSATGTARLGALYLFGAVSEPLPCGWATK